jgi:hypothetical protein
MVPNGGDYCCPGTAHCAAHCVPLTDCDDNGDTGLDFCSSSYGVCCNYHYSTRTPSGYDCSAKRGFRARSVAVESDGALFAEMILVPDKCSSKHSTAPKEGVRTSTELTERR